MGKKVKIQLAPGDRDRLEALIANGNTPQKHVRRARIVLLAGDGVGTDEIKRRLDVSKPTIRRAMSRPALTACAGRRPARQARPRLGRMWSTGCSRSR
jgi:hypothetical protein